jgi:hypothetical protein
MTLTIGRLIHKDIFFFSQIFKLIEEYHLSKSRIKFIVTNLGACFPFIINNENNSNKTPKYLKIN